jgi:hypothetical protein
MVHEEKVYCNTSYVQERWVSVLLLGLATIKTNVYACDFHHWHTLIHQILNPTSVWVLTVVCGWVRVSSHWPKQAGVLSSARYAPCCTSDCHNHFSGGCNIIALLGSRLSSNVMSSRWCDFVTIKSTVSAKILDRQRRSIIAVLTLSATQLHVGKKLWLAVNNLHCRDWANKAILIFRYCCLKAIKHRTTRGVLFPNIVWLQKNFVQSRKNSMLLHAVYLWHSSQMCCCSCIQHGDKNPKL